MFEDRRFIIVLISSRHISFETKLKDLPYRQSGIEFNNLNVHLRYAYYDPYYMSFGLALWHPEFLNVPMGMEVPSFTLIEARKKFPYLFVDTDPILYRDYKEIIKNE